MTKTIVKAILENALNYQWSLQGFGMLRLHLSDSVRLNVWSSRYRVPNVSMIHTHPWDFESQVVAGCLRNVRYEFNTRSEKPTHYCLALIPGDQGGLLPETPVPGQLWSKHLENFTEGGKYRQRAEEIHLSDPMDGTVTVNDRQRRGPDTAQVFYDIDNEWVSAKPRAATPEEIFTITRHSLRNWF